MKSPKETIGAKVRNKLVLPSTVLQLLCKGQAVSKENAKDALDALNEAVELTKQEEGGVC